MPFWYISFEYLNDCHLLYLHKTVTKGKVKSNISKSPFYTDNLHTSYLHQCIRGPTDRVGCCQLRHDCWISWGWNNSKGKVMAFQKLLWCCHSESWGRYWLHWLWLQVSWEFDQLSQAATESVRTRFVKTTMQNWLLFISPGSPFRI